MFVAYTKTLSTAINSESGPSGSPPRGSCVCHVMLRSSRVPQTHTRRRHLASQREMDAVRHKCMQRDDAAAAVARLRTAYK